MRIDEKSIEIKCDMVTFEDFDEIAAILSKYITAKYPGEKFSLESSFSNNVSSIGKVWLQCCLDIIN